jgi:hypothetical protein
MSRDESSTALRILIRGTAGTPGSGDDIANIVTNELPDGAQCFVTGNRTLYRFRKFSSVAVSGEVIIAPIAGGGRWVQEGLPSGAVAAFVTATTTLNTTDASASSDWLPIATLDFALQSGAAPSWDLNSVGAILTLRRPAGRYLCDLRATVEPAEGSRVDAVVSLNNDVVGTATALTEGQEFVGLGANFDAGQQAVILSAQRLVTLVTGDTLQPKFRYSAGADLAILLLTLSVIPVR